LTYTKSSQSPPTQKKFFLKTEAVAYLSNHHIHEIIHRLRAVVKAGSGRHDDRARARKAEQVLEVDLVHRGFPRHEQESAPLLKSNVSGARLAEKEHTASGNATLTLELP